MKTQGNTPTSKKHDAQSARREVARFRHSLAENPSICASLALYWFWQITLFQSPAATLWTASFDAPQLSHPTLLAALAISYAVLWALHRGASKVARRAWYLPVISTLMLCGTAIAIIPLRQSALPLPHAPIAASCLIGVGSAAFVVEMGRFFAKTGTRSALSAGIAGAICGTMLLSLCNMLPTAASDALLTVSPRNRVRASRDSPKGLSERSLLYPWFEQQTEFSATLCRHMSRAGFGLRIYGRHGVVGKPPRVHRTSCSVLHRFSSRRGAAGLDRHPAQARFQPPTL